ncbi:DNA polymerase III subunit beta [Candidatus Babeliales bacterium]|nr:DNA polymerase III subunit beta [Candidatus Babeliales bacterium]
MENKFVIEQKSILSVLSSMQPICTKRTTLDTTNYILFHVGHRELVLKSTDLEISLQANCTLKESDVTETRSFLVSGRRLFDLVKELADDITVTIDDTSLGLTSGTAQLTLNIKDAQEFPPFPERIENLMHLDAKFVLELLNKVAFLIPQNNANPALNGLFLELSSAGLKMTTTDGHCLAQIATNKYKLDGEKKWLLPRRAIFEIKKILESSDDATLFLGTCGNQLVFSGTSFNFFTKLLVDPFPNYSTILDRNGFIPARLDRTNFVKTLRRSSVLLSGQFIATKFAFEKERLSVSLHNKEVGKLDEALALEDFDSDKMEIRFYSPYLLSGLQAFQDEKSTFYLKNPARPIIFESNEKEKGYMLTYLVMPVSPSTQ